MLSSAKQKYTTKPDWLKVDLPSSPVFGTVKQVVDEYRLHSVCQEASCPNRAECFSDGTATFLIMGDTCTRNCSYCAVKSGTPDKSDTEEPERLVQAVRELGLEYVVITSVTRDDLGDGGASIFAHCVQLIRQETADCRVEVLIPDFQGDLKALQLVIDSQPDVINHNIEVVKALFSELRPQGNYSTSIELLRQVAASGLVCKSGFMIGVGESWEQIVELMEELRDVGCQRLTIGQYLQPSPEHWPVDHYYHPDQFDELKNIAHGLGFDHVESGPLVRSSYHASQAQTN